jgi:hypothetical protein
MIEKYRHDLNVILPLQDGRLLSAAIAGEAGGYPLFHFHGAASSRLEVSLMAS